MREPPALPAARYNCSGAIRSDDDDDDDDDVFITDEVFAEGPTGGSGSCGSDGMVTMVVEMDDTGRLPGRMKFCGDGAKPKALLTLGLLKSSIWLFMTMPVSGTMTCEPKSRFTVVVMLMVKPERSAAVRCDVLGLFQSSVSEMKTGDV